MTDFLHSIILFYGEDGLPLEFNIRNTNKKELLKALIEHGGGLCSQSENAVHLISPRTKVLNASLGKKLVSTNYILDCVRQNHLLDVNDYVYTISEASTSDISDDESGNIISNKKTKEPIVNLPDNYEVINMDIDETLLSSVPMKDESSIPFDSKRNELGQNLTSSNTSESFVEGSVGVDSDFKISSIPSKSAFSPEYTSTAKDVFSKNVQNNFGGIPDELSPDRGLQSFVSPLKKNVQNNFEDNHIQLSPFKGLQSLVSPVKRNVQHNYGDIPAQLSPVKGLQSLVSPVKRNVQNNLEDITNEPSPVMGSQSLVSPVKKNDIFSVDDFKLIVQSQKVNFIQRNENPSPRHTVVSSSREVAEFDEFDNLLLSKAQQKHQSDEEECLSQSYTVSSSADAQVGSKPNSEEIFAGGSSAVPDSPMQNANAAKEYQDFIKELESEVKKTLQKPPPKSIQDKICLVKYLCCVMKLPPAKVLELLPSL